ncbi:hypothetical protein GlitD10_0440 [Gloeomargarita lithophora Alchichica-D10]|uniref:Uncharacterized protein n=1 Tax=Gloeomargarita lithophora Alchichica-D10 TaxID=1188229 RepID=A0A1J0A9Z7_9CYAN|nr:hypothetical protein [Gloeomargarita lithophora]APB32751.1 hypothetical protein GlitD10_0440 [Gloeomargarita lithophora Alchichica-D10]
MTRSNYSVMQLDELRRYVLNHREDEVAFQVYVDRSKQAGRMVSLTNENLEEELDKKMLPYRSSEET